jgi:hypothetical protein
MGSSVFGEEPLAMRRPVAATRSDALIEELPMSYPSRSMIAVRHEII